MENAMSWLAETDADYAIAKTDVLRAEILAKRIRAKVFMLKEGSIEARKAFAENEGEVVAADDELLRATLEYESLRAKRQRAELLIDVWRSVESSRRKS
jgi:hypothetical protein